MKGAPEPISSRDSANLGESTGELRNLLQCSKIDVKSEGRVCTKCNIWKPWDDFRKRRDGKNGRASYCRDCRSFDEKAYRSLQRPTVIKNEGDGVSLELTLVPTERFWSGFNRLIDMICDQELKEYERKNANVED